MNLDELSFCQVERLLGHTWIEVQTCPRVALRSHRELGLATRRMQFEAALPQQAHRTVVPEPDFDGLQDDRLLRIRIDHLPAHERAPGEGDLQGFLRIGEVAHAAGVKVQTVRYYERQGLLPNPYRAPSGYRMYGAQTVDTLRAIKRSQALGFTLRDIRQLMAIRSRRRSVSAVREMVAGKVREIDAKIRDLRTMRRSLRDVAERCECGGDLSRCDVLEGLGD